MVLIVLQWVIGMRRCPLPIGQLHPITPIREGGPCRRITVPHGGDTAKASVTSTCSTALRFACFSSSLKVIR